ncbi:hypothetical protein H5410_004896, partial [Solanum commersonii]
WSSPNDSATRPLSVSSLFRSCPHHLHVLDHWVGFAVLEQRAGSVLLATRQVCLAKLRLQLLGSFQPFCSFLRLSIHAFAKVLNT